MTDRTDHTHNLPDDIRTAVGALLERLRIDYPDMSRFTVVSMTGRGRDFLHHLIHTRIGGLLPTILSFDDYRNRRLAEATGRIAVTEDEALLRFHSLRCREKGLFPPPADTQRLLSFLTATVEHSVGIRELRNLDRIGPEQLERLDRLFATMESFRSLLAAEGRFYPPLEEARFADLAPGENELFAGLPLMTPVNQRFFSRVRHDRRFIDAPLFGPHMPAEPPEYETALSLVRRIGVAERRDAGEGLNFTELAERSALPALLAGEIDLFLRSSHSDEGQLIIVLLDETLAFYLWELLFRPLGGRVNFVPWLPFAHFAAAHRLRNAIRGGARLADLRRDLVSELSARWHALDEADRAAFEGAIALCDELTRLRPLMGDGWSTLAEHLVAAKKLHLRGKRSAPIQVVGMGDAIGIPYERAVILPMNSGIFPRKPFRGPYLNLIHLPRIHRTRFEADDLALRQFLSFGHTAHIVAVYDQAEGTAPSSHFAFLSTEFGKKPVKRRMAPEPFGTPTGIPAIENSDELSGQLRLYTWSFSSLSLIFTCPYRFILQGIQKVTPPPCFEEEEHANLLIGDFLHRFFAKLKDHHPAVERWPSLFEALWESDVHLRAKLPDHAVRKAIARSYLADIAAWEREPEKRLLFSDEVAAAELDLSASFGDGRYRIGGRIDRLQRHDGRLLIADLKYKEKRSYSEKAVLADRVEATDAFDERFQLLIYAYLALRGAAATSGPLEAAHLFLRPKARGDYAGWLPEAELAGCDTTMARIAQRLDRALGAERFIPNYRAHDCPYCPYKALCLRPDLYRAGGRPW
ncbi:MAG: PD-(D/E)XK nuclease family protein [Deltaproteobacteria bacterium]|nr:PD-(D/E)XK nuclease family protein [Deltaproteobacteria bacterium]